MAGPESPHDELFAACYPELKRLARMRLSDTDRGATLDTTALVHDAYLKLTGMSGFAPETRAQFMAYAAHTMRSIIVDAVRSRAAEMHGGGAQHLPLDTDLSEKLAGNEARVLDVHRALDRLAEVDTRLVQVVEMRYFAGFSEEEVARSLGLTDRTVRRDWQRARVLLAALLGS
jgi:RNA polymerase sigma factor (TIGR02999 family)